MRDASGEVVETSQQQQQQPPLVSDQLGPNQVVSVDQNALVPGQNVIPLQLSVDAAGNLTDGGVTLQSLDGVQLTQLTLPIQIGGLESNLILDQNALQQLQQGALTITPTMLNQQNLQTADPNLVQNVHLQQVAPTDAVNPNIIIQQPQEATQPSVSNELQQVAVQQATMDATQAQGPPQQIVTLQEQQQVQTQQPDIQQVTFQGGQLALQHQTQGVMDSTPVEAVGEEDVSEDDEDEDDDEAETPGVPDISENLGADESGLVLGNTTTDTSVLDEQQSADAVTGRDQSLMHAAQTHTIVTAAPATDSDRAHVCPVSTLLYWEKGKNHSAQATGSPLCPF